MIVVDPIKIHPVHAIQPAARRWGQHWCHLMEDTGDTAALVLFAAHLGLKASYLQHGDRPLLAHFDLIPSKRALALRLGAVEQGTIETYRKTRAVLAAPALIPLTEPCRLCQQPVLRRSFVHTPLGYEHEDCRRQSMIEEVEGR